MTIPEQLLESMVPGRVYRREELGSLSNNLTQGLLALVERGKLVQAAEALYYRPKETSVGLAPASGKELVRAFLSDEPFLFVSFNEYNLLGLGLTQLHNQQFVYNRKFDGDFTLDEKCFSFRRRKNFPERLTVEFLLVDLFNNRSELSGDTRELEMRVAEKARKLAPDELLRSAKDYGSVETRAFFEDLLA